jgi:hypothetical protein
MSLVSRKKTLINSTSSLLLFVHLGRIAATRQLLLATYRESAFHLATPPTLGQGNVYSYAQANGMQLKQTRREEETVSTRGEKLWRVFTDTVVGWWWVR